MLALVSTWKLQLKWSACEHTHLCVNYDIIEAPSRHNFQCRCIGNVLDGDQVSQQPLHFAVVPVSLWVSLRRQKYMHYITNYKKKTTVICELKYQPQL